MKDALAAWVDSHTEELIDATRAILRIPSVTDDATIGPGAPFGRPCADALEQTLALCEAQGLRTGRFDGYAGHAEFGPVDAPEMVGMLGHLDVVPAGDGWSVDPWGGLVRDGWLWGRGASDDKGPTYAAIFGALAVQALAGDRLRRRIRLIFGCDEESGWACMNHYFGVAAQEKPTVAFTPDAGFPLYFAEKGAFTAVIEKPVAPGVGPCRIARWESGLRANMVPEAATALLVGDPSALTDARRILRSRNRVQTLTTTDGLTVTAHGRSAHGATPQKGRNAAVRLAKLLAPIAGAGWLVEIANRAAPDGSGFDLAGADRIAGPLTCNVGIVGFDGTTLSATVNMRYPVTWDPASVEAKFRSSAGKTGWRIASYHDTPPLYVPTDQEPVQTLLRVYREHTGDRRRPLTTGGRTYATVVAPAGVAFGPARPGDPDVAHRPDERIALERLTECARIYAHALYELAK